MPKIIKNGLEYSGVPTEVVTAWPPTGDSVLVDVPEMGNTDISSIGDGTLTGAISSVQNSLTDINSVTAGTNITINNGGYTKTGRIVVVSLKLTTTAQISQNGILVSGLPYTLQNVYVNCGSGYNPNAYSARTGQDKLYANGTIPNATELNIAVAYLSSN